MTKEIDKQVENKDFEIFWNENLKFYKEQALIDFKSLSSGKYYCTILMDRDDDFRIDIDDEIKVYGNTKKEIREKVIKIFENAELVYGSMVKWNYLRDETIARLKRKENNFSFGGNQTIELSINLSNSKDLKFKPK